MFSLQGEEGDREAIDMLLQDLLLEQVDSR